MSPDLDIDLDRSSPVPLYFQVAEQISDAIKRGELPPGSRLDNEIQLAARLGLPAADVKPIATADWPTATTPASS